jgi:hypothetical protein
MPLATDSIGHRPALVTRPQLSLDEPTQYLLLSSEGAPAWTGDPTAATAFESMREAIRAATRLPSRLRAFGLPVPCDLPPPPALH